MAVFTKLNQADILDVQNIFGFSKIKNFKGIKKGIENTNYIINTKSKKYVLTIFESRVNNKDLPYFMKLMNALSKRGVKCPCPVKNKSGKYIFDLKRKKAVQSLFQRVVIRKNFWKKTYQLLVKKLV